MTLIIASAIGGKYSLTTGDTRRVTGMYWEDTETGEWGRTGEYETTKKIVQKVHPLTNYVTFAGAGTSELIEEVYKRLKDKASRNDGVMYAGLLLEQVIEEIRKEAATDPSAPLYYKLVDGDSQGGEAFGVVLNGFTNEMTKGESGFSVYIAGYSKRTLYQEIKKNEYAYVFWAPGRDYTLKKDEYMKVDLTSTERDFETLRDQQLKIHAVISSLEPDTVSELFDYRALSWHKKKRRPAIEEKRFNLSQYYDKLGLT